jgi:neuromedin U receptor 1
VYNNIWFPAAYPFSNVVCVIQSLLQETATNATVLTILTFSVERYIAICHPFRAHTMSTLSRALKCIVVIWMLALLLAAPQALQFGVIVLVKGQICSVSNYSFIFSKAQIK